MAKKPKRKSKFPWPDIGDGLFNDRDDVRFNAFLGGKPFNASTIDAWSLYASGYMESLEYILNSFVRKKNPAHRDSMIYPILFLFHHCLELRFKWIIKNGGHLIGIKNDIPNTHKISALWPNTRRVIIEMNKGADKAPINAVEKIIKELTKISNSSDGYRYPITLDGDNIIKNQDIINIKNLRKVILNTNAFFDAVSMQLDHINEQIDEHNSAMQFYYE